MTEVSKIDAPVASAERPPATTVGAVGWLRANLFNTWYNSILTLLLLWAIAAAIVPLVNWVILGAAWGEADPQTGKVSADICRDITGACWAFVHEKWRLIFFGTYPYAEQWRPGVGMIILIALIAVSCNRRFWNWSLAFIWLVGSVAFGILMWGGVLGLPYVSNENWGGLALTLILSVVGIGAAFPLAILLALGRRSDLPAIKALCVAFIELIRGVPLVTVLFMASFMLPFFMPEGVTVDKLLRAQIAIILFVAAYLAEVIRGGLQAIPKGQYEAADALGLPYWKKTGFIILPQALRLVIPPIVNTFIGAFKDTSLVVIVSVLDMMLMTRQALGDAPFRPYFVEAYVFTGFIYWVFCFCMSKYSQYLERDLGRAYRR